MACVAFGVAQATKDCDLLCAPDAAGKLLDLLGEAYLDIFGVAPRGSSPWETELQGFYAGPHTVAEMKRTNQAARFVLPGALDWLPDVRGCFIGLSE